MQSIYVPRHHVSLCIQLFLPMLQTRQTFPNLNQVAEVIHGLF